MEKCNMNESSSTLRDCLKSKALIYTYIYTHTHIYIHTLIYLNVNTHKWSTPISRREESGRYASGLSRIEPQK